MIAIHRTVLLLASLSSGVAAAIPDVESPRFVDLSVYPPRVELHRSDEGRRVVAVATQEDGVTIDVTELGSWRLEAVEADNGALAFEGGELTATTDASGVLSVEFGGRRAEVIVTAGGISHPPPASFRHDVIPILTVSGCNAGGCHGASRGKDGFRLSLFGFDPASDHHGLTREMVNRRLSLAAPDESLLLLKSIGAVTHTGGKRFEKSSERYEKLREWIADGAPNDLQGAPTVTGLSIYPPSAAIGAGGHAQRFIAVAAYSDGTSRDVTRLAVFQSNNETSASVNAEGVVTSDRRGEAFVSARFDTHTVGSQVLVLPTGSRFKPREEAPANYIDELVGQKLDTLRIHPSGACTDGEFLRRVCIDIAGRLPTPEETRYFVTSTEAGKRAAKVDELLEDPGFDCLWGQKWSDLLLVRTQPNRVEYKPMFKYSRWLTDQIASRRPLDEMVHDLLSSSGTTFDTPQTNFYQIEPDAKKIAENVAQTFLGIRLQCAQCHNHPFDRWTMDDYYGFTAFFTQIARKPTDDYREWMVFNRGSGESKHPVGGRSVPPKPLGDNPIDTNRRDRRAVIADWIVSPENPWFAPSVANRVWAHFFGIGVVDPVDDIRVSNPPSNPELFDRLGEQLIDYGYDLRRLVRDITLSNTYQRSCSPNESNAEDTRNFARAHPRRIPAETLLDCLSQATDAPGALPNLPAGSRATQIADGRAGNYFLTTFGRSRRETVCACEAKSEPTLSQALHLMNGSTIQGKLKEGRLIERKLQAGSDAEQVLDDLFLRSLARFPTESERSALLTALDGDTDPAAALQDVFWALLNSREFLFNH